MSAPIWSTELAQAAQNNAQWCDTICRAHGAPGEFSEQLWLTRHKTPRFYPNAVTLAPTPQALAAHTHLADRLANALPAQGAVKDSFCTLDLAPWGFQSLFTAMWLWRPPAPLPSQPSLTHIQWATVQAPAELARWEAAWNGQPTDAAAPDAEVAALPRVFLPTLLADPDISFIAAYQQEQIIAGAIANRTGDVVGVSNLFYPAQDAPAYWAGCVATIVDRYPTHPLVGYEQGDDLVMAQTLGFTALGPLRLWAR